MVSTQSRKDRQLPDLKKNYIYRLLYELTLLAGPLITVPYVSRVLGPTGVGDFSFTYSVATYFILFCALGLSGYGTREISRCRDNEAAVSRLFWEIRLSGMIPGLICLVLWGIFILLTTRYKLLYLALTPYLLGAIFEIQWFYIGLEQVKDTALCGIGVRILGIILTFLLINDSGDTPIYCALNSSIVLITHLSMWLMLPKYLKKVSLKNIPVRKHLKETLVYFIPSIVMSIYMVLDKFLIGVITKDSCQNGYYEQADRVISVTKTFVYWVMVNVASARMSYLYAQDRHDEIKSAISKSMDYIFFMGYGAVFGLLGISHNLVPIFFGPGYEPVEKLIWLMLPLILIVSITNCLENYYYIPAGKRAQSTKYILAGAILNLIMNICLIPFWGADGAVMASLVAEVLIAVLFMIHCNSFLPPALLGSLSIKRILAGIPMAVAVWFTGTLAINGIAVLLIQMAAGVILYCLLLLMLRDSLITDVSNNLLDKIKKNKG